MTTLSEDLKRSHHSLEEFKNLTIRIAYHRNNTISSEFVDHRGYRIQKSISGNTKKYLRPVKIDLFIWDLQDFEKKYNEFINIISKIKNGKREFNDQEHNIINSVLYTIQQSIGIGLDLEFTPNSARKHVGNRFEELIRVIVSALGLKNRKMVFKVPYKSGGKQQVYKSETDIIISSGEVKSTSNKLDPNEIVVSIKTTSKDRMGKMFLDKLLLKEMFKLDNVKVVGIFLNDVQRNKTTKTSFTIVPGQFIVYSNYIEQMEGVYYLDTPATIENKPPFSEMIRPFSEFLITGIWELFRP
ncbi:hypothetical protein [Zunongwangia sp. H14]|uniref:hypothetical protein n=1 Tax=Zunongwangia sp. H14 TaxID=3240792 RepID=UPI0035659075